MGVSADAPSLDSAYKLVEYDGRPMLKLSEAKATEPGRKQVFRGRARTWWACATSRCPRTGSRCWSR